MQCIVNKNFFGSQHVASTADSPRLIPGERNSSSVVFNLANQMDAKHVINYTVTVITNVTRIMPCDVRRETCTVVGLAANSKLDVSLITCCEHNLCSLPTEVTVYTKPEGEFAPNLSIIKT